MKATIVRFLPEIFGIFLVLLCHRLLRAWYSSARAARWLQISQWVGIVALLGNLPMIWRIVPPGPLFTWARGAGILWAIASCGTTIGILIARWLGRSSRTSQAENTEPAPDPGRRAVLRTAQSAVVAAPALMLGYGALYERRRLTPQEVKITVPGLAADLHGLKIALLSDIHMSSFLSASDLRAAVDMANSFRPDITAVTGDLITRDGDPLEECLRELKRLRAASGVYGCMGNHEVYADCEDLVESASRAFGMRYLRSDAVTLPFGQARIRLAGVDYQKMHGNYLVGGERLLEDGTFPILLSHNPDVFDVAAAQGWGLTLAGHTHGGQVTVEYLHQHLNLARFFTPYVYGHYQKENSHIYVTRGIGTVGVPARIGAVPEVALIELCAT